MISAMGVSEILFWQIVVTAVVLLINGIFGDGKQRGPGADGNGMF